MAERIAAHRRERPAHWRVRETPLRLAAALREEAANSLVSREATSQSTPRAGLRKPGLILVDCLTVWTANCLWPQFVTEAIENPTAAEREVPPDITGWRRERDEFLDVLREIAANVILVSNEVGTGIVPERPAARVFRDEQGWLNQAVAAICDEAFWVTAGLPLRLK